jgi:hypothetical protein
VTTLAAKTADFRDSHTLDTDFVEPVFDFFELVMSDDGFNLFHREDPSGGQIEVRP